LEENSAGSVGCRSVPLGDLTYTVLDIETTGLKPQGNGITEICCLRIEGGRLLDRFSTLVNPGIPIPHFIQTMTGITDSMVRDAPSFDRLIPDLLAFLGDTVLVAHNAPFDLSFLNYGLYCHGRRHLHNPVVDTCRLSRKLIPGLSSAGLDSVVRHLGVQVKDRHRAGGDAEATVGVLLKLLELCQAQGIETDAQLAAFTTPARPKRDPKSPPRPGSHAERLAVLAERCRAVPDASGIYIMHSASGRILYVGKAISLRRRLASYFSDDIYGKTRRLMREVESIEHRQLGSELEALLEESDAAGLPRLPIPEDRRVRPLSPSTGDPGDPPGWRPLLRPPSQHEGHRVGVGYPLPLLQAVRRPLPGSQRGGELPLPPDGPLPWPLSRSGA